MGKHRADTQPIPVVDPGLEGPQDVLDIELTGGPQELPGAPEYAQPNTVVRREPQYATGGFIYTTNATSVTVNIPQKLSKADKIRKYAKGIVSFAGALGVSASTLTLAPDPTRWDAWINAGIAFLTALGVIGVRNGKKK